VLKKTSISWKNMTDENPVIDEKTRPGFDRKMTGEEINQLPIASYDGEVHIIRTPSALDHAVRALCKETLLGFDTETKPAFEKGENNPLSLIQLAGKKAVYILQVKYLSSCQQLGEVLSAKHIIKAGIDIQQDIVKLKSRIDGDYKGFVDISVLAKDAGMKNFSMRGLAAILLGVRVAKSMQVSNWARSTLTPSQIRYAATDAWISRELYVRLRPPR
jgi:ribonuclease D